MKVAIYNKYVMSKVSTNFRISEFACKCSFTDCTFTLLDERLVAGLQLYRDWIGEPVYITSGYRCQGHNSDVGGMDHSRHLRGIAADLEFSKRADLSIDEQKSKLKQIFDVVITYEDEGFFHVHNLE